MASILRKASRAAFAPPGAGFSRRIRRRVTDVYRAILIVAGDLAVAIPPARFLLSLYLRDEPQTMRAAGFDDDLYLRQLPTRRRALAARDPALHYCLLGWRETRTPSMRFDPVFAAAYYPESTGNPFAEVSSSGGPQNDLEVRGRSPNIGSAVGSAVGCALVFHHARGGGSTKCLGAFEDRLVGEGLVPLRVRLVPRSDRLVILQTTGAPRVHDLIDGFPGFVNALQELSIARIVVSHVVDFCPEHILGLLPRLSAHYACPIDLLLHDYLAVCARINLVTDRETVCFSPPDVSQCRSCIANGGSEIGVVDPGQWRMAFAALATEAQRIYVLSEDMRERLAPFLPDRMIIWRPEIDVAARPIAPKINQDDVLRIVVIGALNVAKGSKVVAALGAAALARDAPITIEVFGDSPERKLLVSAGVIVHGRYRESDLSKLLLSSRAHAAFIPAIWPETWSFVLTQLLALRLPVFSFDHGAQAERLRAVGQAQNLLSSRFIDDPQALLDEFLRYRSDHILRDAYALA